jgi:hypothetical protein
MLGKCWNIKPHLLNMFYVGILRSFLKSGAGYSSLSSKYFEDIAAWNTDVMASAPIAILDNDDKD